MAIVIENTGSGLNGAFDVIVNDSLPSGITLVPNSICASDGTGSGMLNSGDLFGAGFELTDPGPTDPDAGALDAYDPADGRNIAVITYAVTIDAGVTTGAALTNTASLINFAGTEGGIDHTTVNQQDSADVTIVDPVFRKTVYRYQHQFSRECERNGCDRGAGNLYPDRYFPEGLTPAASIVDNLDTGLAFVDLVSVTASNPDTDGVGGSSDDGLNTAVMIFDGSGLCTNCTAGNAGTDNPFIENNGQRVTINFGNVVNTNQDNTQSETITIVYRAVVLNVIENQSGTSLNNAAVMSWTGGSDSAAAANITVVEPDLTITKSYLRTNPTPAALTPVDAGDEITYTIVVSNTSTIDAFDVLVSDTLPTTTINSWTVSGVIDTAGLLTNSDFTISAGVFSTVPASAFDLPANNGRSVTITLTGTILDTILPNTQISNTAHVTWTSLDGNQSDLSSYNSDSDERTGSDGIGSGLNNYAENSNVLSFNTRALSGTKYFVASSEPGTLDTPVPPKLTIGEIVRYRLAMQIPEGILTDLAMLDRLPAYLRFLNDGTAKFAFVSQLGISSSTFNWYQYRCQCRRFGDYFIVLNCFCFTGLSYFKQPDEQYGQLSLRYRYLFQTWNHL